MENASKALLMTASMLIGLLVISLAVYLFVSFGTQSAQIHKQRDQDELNQFNIQFMAYEGKDDVTIYDVVTVANLASENNLYYELSKNDANKNTFYVSVNLIGKNARRNIEVEDKTFLDKMIKDNMFSNDNATSGELKKYKCQTLLSDITGRVYEVNFEEK